MIELKYSKINNVLEIAKDIIKENVNIGDIVLDCTTGNGKDTLLLRRSVGHLGKVYGFDIQEEAIKNTKKLIGELNDVDNVILYNDSHENIDSYIDEELSCIVYNLGYLPGGDKTIKTNAISTIKSIEKSLKLLKSNGILLVIVYPGHPGGKEEKNALEDLFANLDQRYFNVLKYEFINQVNNPPILYFLEKSKEVYSLKD